MPRRLTAAALVLLTLTNAASATSVSAQQEPVVVYLVRHAERAEDGTNDPPISQAGQDRARLLADLLRDAGVTRLHTTDLKRTRQTGAPLAEALVLEMSTYDPRDLLAFAARLRASPGRHVVFGHSNTTPALVEALGGDPGGPIADGEYDRLYAVVIPAEGPVSTLLLRFGAAWRP
jgi:phosphohistidine phosphatase SixA